MNYLVATVSRNNVVTTTFTFSPQGVTGNDVTGRLSLLAAAGEAAR